MQLGLVSMTLSQCEHHATKHTPSIGIFLFVRNGGQERDENKKIRSHNSALFLLNPFKSNAMSSFCTSSNTIH